MSGLLNKISSQFVQFSLLNPDSRLRKHGFEKYAFQVLKRDNTYANKKLIFPNVHIGSQSLFLFRILKLNYN